MNDWEKSKKNFIDKLSKADEIFGEIFKADSDSLVIQGEEREKLTKLQTANKKILDKLKSGEFTVAIVGLEKAGKSTLGNALIKLMVLPEYDGERCTFTTTEIRSGMQDLAKVSFYTEEEFNKIFIDMLKAVEYPLNAATNYSTMTLPAFKLHWQTVEQNLDKQDLFNKYEKSIAADLTTILTDKKPNGNERIQSLLGRSEKTYGEDSLIDTLRTVNNVDGTQTIEFNEFKTYITGILRVVKFANGTQKNIDRVADPYAVKNVFVSSTNLNDMSHIVLYDVPGFDSPTEIHQRQTKEKLQDADAIIFVVNASANAQFVAPQLNMLLSIKDPYDVKLSDKTFVFANRLDMANSPQVAKNNLNGLQNDSVRQKIAKREHVFGGSARAALEDLGFFPPNEITARNKLNEWKRDHPDVIVSDGIDDLRQAIHTYYDNDRYEKLKERAEKILNDTRDILQELFNRYSNGDLSYMDASTEILMEIQSRLPKFLEEAHRITQDHMEKILLERPFTKAITENIKNIYPSVDANLPLIRSVELQVGLDGHGIYQTTAVDSNVRDKLNVQFIEAIVTKSTEFTSGRQTELRQKLVDSFLTIMGMETTTTHKEALNDSVNELFDNMLVKGGAECNFNSLIERFTLTLIETLIKNPFASPARCLKVKEALDELVSFSVYYNMPTNDDEKNRLQLENLINGGDKFFARILAHEDLDAKIEAFTGDNEIFLRNLFEKKRELICEGALLDIDALPFEEWARLITEVGINLNNENIREIDTLEYKLMDLLYSYDSKWNTLSADRKRSSLDNLVRNYTEQFKAQNQPPSTNFLLGQLDEIQRRASGSKSMNGKDDMIATLNEDIKILRDITSKAVINAIGLERAFNSIIIKNVDLIRNHLQKPEGHTLYRAWIRNNAVKLMPSHFETIVEQGAIRESRRAIVNVIKTLFDKWN